MRTRLLFLTVILLISIPVAHAQGCTQCRDNTAATPPRTQAAYRHAIELLVIVAGTIFAGSALLLKRSR